MHQPNDTVAARSITDSFLHSTRPCTIGQTQVINEMESWDLSWKILQLNFDIKHSGKYFKNAHPERRSPHQPHSELHPRGQNHTILSDFSCHDWRLGNRCPSLEEGARVPCKRGKRRFCMWISADEEKTMQVGRIL